MLRSCYELVNEDIGSLLILNRLSLQVELQSVGVRSAKIKWIIIQEKEPIRLFLERHEKVLNQCGWVSLLTVNRPFATYSQLIFLGRGQHNQNLYYLTVTA